ncbi:hypothetical protein E4U33_003412 [Claviceps sp. LM78 group G4]|nr:hypothetical protein E4U33_003412 [Claviceps sp. LM78 group G4]
MIEKQRTYLAANHLQESAEERVAACTGLFTKSMGLPCKHTISQRLADNLILELRDIDPHWYFDREINPEDLIVDRPMPILEPLVTVTRRGRPQGSTATISASQAPIDGSDTPRGRGRPRGRPRGSRGVRGAGRSAGGNRRGRGDASTARDPSHFEIIEQNHTWNAPAAGGNPLL